MTSGERRFDLSGLTVGPSQVWGPIRLVPLLRDVPISGLRLHGQPAGEPGGVGMRVASHQVGYIPHAFVAAWPRRGRPTAAYGTQLCRADGAEPTGVDLWGDRRLAHLDGERRLRFLPQRFALEGYLTLQFGGPPVAWREWSDQVVTRGLSPQVQAAYLGSAIPGLDDALRVFEIDPDQCGVLLYVADVLAAAFVLPHPEDYRALHPTLLCDMYGDLLFQYAHLHGPVDGLTVRFDESRIDSVADLRAWVNRARYDWRALHNEMADGLIGVDRVATRRLREESGFTLSRLVPSFVPGRDNHVGEAVTDDAGRLAYLETFRLSNAQTRRGYLLSRLEEHGWDLDDTAVALGTDRSGLVRRLDDEGFGYLLRADVLDACRAGVRRRR